MVTKLVNVQMRHVLLLRSRVKRSERSGKKCPLREVPEKKTLRALHVSVVYVVGFTVLHSIGCSVVGRKELQRELVGGGGGGEGEGVRDSCT